MLKEAFGAILSLVKAQTTIERPGKYSAMKTYISASNYSRNLSLSGDITIPGREFVIQITDLPAEYDPPKRGDILTDSILGRLSISEVNEMTGLKGELLAYRIRTS